MCFLLYQAPFPKMGPKEESALPLAECTKGFPPGLLDAVCEESFAVVCSNTEVWGGA